MGFNQKFFIYIILQDINFEKKFLNVFGASFDFFKR